MNRLIGLIYFLFSAFLPSSGYAQAWKTIQVNPIRQIDMASIRLINGKKLANTQMINPYGLFAITKNIVDCDERIIEQKRSLLQEEDPAFKYSETTYFRQSQGEWWDFIQIEMGTRYSKIHQIMGISESKQQESDQKLDRTKEMIYELVCSASI